MILLAGGGAAAYAGTSAAPAGYRTTMVTTGEVDQLLNTTGTIALVDQVRARFRTSGIVATVAVAIGDQVTAGQTLAALATAPLSDAVLQANATLTKAQATLETDQAAAAAAATPVPVSPSTPAGTGGRGSGGGASGTGSVSGSGGSLASAQQNATGTLAAATDALATAEQACASNSSVVPSSAASPSVQSRPSRAANPSSSTRPTPSAHPGGAGGSSSGSSCAAALQRSLRSQQQAATAARQLLQALRAAATTVGTTGTTATGAPRSASTSSTAESASTGAGGQGNQGGQGGSAESVASRVTLDIAAVGAAQTGLSSAQADLAGATLTSPIAGTVSVLPYTAGKAAGTSQAITVLGPGAALVTVAVPATTLGRLAVGQQAAVTADGATTAVAARVDSIALLASTTTSSSTPTYAVKVLVPQAGKAFVNGSSAAVSITIKTATGVLTVANSALGNGYVSVLNGTKVVRTRVTTGAVGALVTEVTGGLTAGQYVVLADLSKVLPANSTTTIRGLNGGAGGGGYPGGPPGGAAGGRPGG